MEPAGIEPATSCLQSPSERGRLWVASGSLSMNSRFLGGSADLRGCDPGARGFHKASTRGWLRNCQNRFQGCGERSRASLAALVLRFRSSFALLDCAARPTRAGDGIAGRWDGPMGSSVSPAFEVRLGHSLEGRPVHLPGGRERHFVEDDYFLGRFVADPRPRELN